MDARNLWSPRIEPHEDTDVAAGLWGGGGRAMDPGRLLIIDDDSESWRVGSAAAKGLGWQVHRSSKVLAAVDREARLRPDAVAIDLDMHGGDGFAVIRRIAALATTLRLVIFGASGDQGYLERAQRLAEAFGVTTVGCLAKPLQGHSVAAVLAEVLGAPAGPTGPPIAGIGPA
ncbi:MAG: response regulator [Alphaproteobacteria bacterium]|nr:response regulator [Alphaproteobacteria bacterium]